MILLFLLITIQHCQKLLWRHILGQHRNIQKPAFDGHPHPYLRHRAHCVPGKPLTAPDFPISLQIRHCLHQELEKIIILFDQSHITAIALLIDWEIFADHLVHPVLLSHVTAQYSCFLFFRKRKLLLPIPDTLPQETKVRVHIQQESKLRLRRQQFFHLLCAIILKLYEIMLHQLRHNPIIEF